MQSDMYEITLESIINAVMDFTDIINKFEINEKSTHFNRKI